MSTSRLHSFLVTYTARRPGLPHSFKSNVKMPQRNKDDYPTNGDARQWIMRREKDITNVEIINVEECFEDTRK